MSNETPRDDTDLSKILPNLLLLLTFSFPLLPNNLGNVRIIEPRFARSNSLLVVLPIKNKCYKESAPDGDVRKQGIHLFVQSQFALPIWVGRNEGQRNIGLTIPRAGYFRFRLAKTDMGCKIRRSS